MFIDCPFLGLADLASELSVQAHERVIYDRERPGPSEFNEHYQRSYKCPMPDKSNIGKNNVRENGYLILPPANLWSTIPCELVSDPMGPHFGPGMFRVPAIRPVEHEWDLEFFNNLKRLGRLLHSMMGISQAGAQTMERPNERVDASKLDLSLIHI